jgi:outer membrane protein assembly factor BamA
MKPDAPRGVVDIDIPVRRGPLVRYCLIEASGNVRVPSEVLYQEVGLREGDAFSESALEDAQKRLEALGAFRHVSVVTEPGCLASTRAGEARWIVRFEVEEY